MNTIEVKIELLKGCIDTQLETQDYSNAIVVESASELHFLSKITLAGHYCREYTVASELVELNGSRVLPDGKTLLILLWSELAIVDIENNKLSQVIKFDCCELFGIYKFKSGYFIHGEDTTRYLNGNLEQVWERGAIDIFAGCKLDNVVDIFDDYWTITDWCGYKHHYNEEGEFLCEYCPQYDSNK